uniref:F-box domain-containing protein n=1 Tax=Arundo donax TaxID=35708 RepID=A0A0A9F6V3_ARUDO
MARGGRRVAQGGRPHELGRGGWLGCAVGRFAEALLLSQTPKCRRSPHVRRIAARRKVSRWRRSKNAPKEGGAGGDGNGIDALPDEVLQHVLSFPTAQEAVRTCVLARRWRHLWRSIPVLRVAAHGCLDQQGVNKLNKFVSYRLLLRDPSALLDVCDVKICAFDQGGDAPQVDLLVVCALFLKANLPLLTTALS